MFKIKYILLSGLLLLLQSGCTDPIPTPPPSINKVGIGLSKGDIEHYSNSPQGLYYYGQVLIEPKLAMQTLSGPEAQTFFSHVTRIFKEKRENFGLSVTPIIDGHRLPDIVLFTYSYDSKTQQWITTFNEEPRTAMTLLRAETELSFELKYTSINKETFNQVKEITKSIYGGNILLSATSLPIIDLIGDKVSGILSHSVNSSTTLYFSPVADAKKSVEYSIQTKDGKKLAEVKFSLILRDSVVTGAVVESELNNIPKVNSLTNPLNMIRTHINDTLTLSDKLQREESVATFFQINEPIQFRNKCIDIQNRLETYGLNIFDRYSAFAQILERTNFLTNRQLYHSGCLSNRKLNIMNEMGISMPPPPEPKPIHIILNDKVLQNFGRYMLNPLANVGFKSDLLKLFSDTVMVQKNDLISFDELYTEDDEVAMTPETFMKRLGEIGVARYGSYSRQVKEYRYFLFRPLSGSTIYRIKLKRERTWGRIRTVIIEPWSDEKIALITQRKLRRIAKKTVYGYKDDALRKENQIEIALNN